MLGIRPTEPTRDQAANAPGFVITPTLHAPQLRRDLIGVMLPSVP
jgi:hypothetical protein